MVLFCFLCVARIDVLDSRSAKIDLAASRKFAFETNKSFIYIWVIETEPGCKKQTSLVW